MTLNYIQQVVCLPLSETLKGLTNNNWSYMNNTKFFTVSFWVTHLHVVSSISKKIVFQQEGQGKE
jgi:hypothetical protein